MSTDPRLVNTIYAEAGGGRPDEIAAVASTFLNRARQYGMDKALLGSSAYRLRSPQYQKASSGNLTPYEKQFYKTVSTIIGDLEVNPDKVQPWTHFENVKAFGEPSWAKGMASFQDIGRQRFYVEKPKPRMLVLKKPKK